MAIALFAGTGYLINPLKFYAFEDGVYIVQASSDYQHLVGTKLVGINNVDITTVNQEIDQLLTRDNAQSLKTNRNLLYITPTILNSAGIASSNNSVVYNLMTDNGDEISEEVTAISPSNFPVDVSINLEKDSEVLYLSSSENFWYESLNDNSTFYIKMNAMAESASTGSLEQFGNEIVHEVTTKQYSKIVLDLRQNNGGNNQLIDGIISVLQHPAINQTGKLYVATDAQTFSAAGNLVAVIDEKTNAHFIGTSPGGSGTQYGDTKEITLPYSKYIVYIPTRYWQFGNPSFQPLVQPMDIVIEPTGADYFSKIDPVMDWINE